MSENITEEEKNLVIARIQRMPPNYELSLGGSGRLYNREELIDSVKKENKVGRLIVRIQLNYLRSFKQVVEAHA